MAKNENILKNRLMLLMIVIAIFPPVIMYCIGFPNSASMFLSEQKDIITLIMSMVFSLMTAIPVAILWKALGWLKEYKHFCPAYKSAINNYIIMCCTSLLIIIEYAITILFLICYFYNVVGGIELIAVFCILPSMLLLILFNVVHYCISPRDGNVNGRNCTASMDVLLCMTNFLQEKNPEVWLEDSKLNELIIDQRYQRKMAKEVRPHLPRILPPLSEQTLSFTLETAKQWFEDNMYGNVFDNELGTQWRKILQDEIETLQQKMLTMPEQKIRERVVFWVVFRSVLKMLEGKKVVVGNTITGKAYIV